MVDGFNTPFQQIMAHLLEFSTGQVTLITNIIMQSINVNWYIIVGTQNMLGLVRLNAQLRHGTSEFPHIFLLSIAPLLIPDRVEFVRHMVYKTSIKSFSTEGSIPCLSKNLERTNFLSFAIFSFLPIIRVKLHDRYLKRRSTHVVEHNVLGLLLNTINSIVKSSSSGLINQCENIEVCESRCVEECTTLVLGVE